MVLVEVPEELKCPKVLSEGAKGVFGPPGGDSQNSLLHGAKPRSRLLPPGTKEGLHGAIDFLGTLGWKTPNDI